MPRPLHGSAAGVMPWTLGEPTAQSAAGVLRRVPTQQRSAERVDRMLDACAELLEEAGYDRMTTTLVARRAGVAIGSVYQFFGDKRAVVRALGLRHLDDYFGRLRAQLERRRLEHWRDLADMAVDEYIAMHRAVPGFRTLHFGDVVDTHLLDEARTNNDVVADRLLSLLEERFAPFDRRRMALRLSVAVEAGDALVKLAFRRGSGGDEAVLREAKALIGQYLSLGESETSAPRIPRE